MSTVVHLTPHLGGGVGKAVSGLIATAATGGSQFRHSVICLEKPEKSQFVERLDAAGCDVVIKPDDRDLLRRLEEADIVQVEFWNHPTLPAILCRPDLPAMRMIAWCHVSGLHHPRFPPNLIEAFDQIVFTSACSFEGAEVRAWCEAGHSNKLRVISSGGGVENLPLPLPTAGEATLRAGYLGSFNYSKLHPEFVSFLAAVPDPEFCVRMIGDETNRSDLERQCRALGREHLLDFRGYRSDVVSELAQLDVLIYLLNPTHYGTAENALLEAMAMGVIPVVLNNPAERCIVEHRKTGVVIKTPHDLALSIAWLQRNPSERVRIKQSASTLVRERFSFDPMVRCFEALYAYVLPARKIRKSFTQVFGETSTEWFLSFLRDSKIFCQDGSVSAPIDAAQYGLLEKSKGSVSHFSSVYSEDAQLRRWAMSLESLLVK
ncbi:MAG: glycosyltransferase [Telmatospirillum sp.]|nr:glycosyltransferase [Telmatospirillum sp.]